jgi:hypothetical protein
MLRRILGAVPRWAAELRRGSTARVAGQPRFALPILLAGLIPAPVIAQEVGDSLERSLVASLRVPEGGEDSIRVTLSRRVRYVLEIRPSDARFIVAAARHASNPALVVPLDGAPSNVRRFEVYARENGEHVIHAAAPAGVASLLLWTDIRATREAEAARIATEENTWSLGLTAGLGQHGGYFADPTETGTPAGGTDFEVGLLIGSGSTVASTVGFAHQAFGALGYSMNWVYAEPRFKVASFRVAGPRATDLGVSLRIGQGNASDRQVDPVVTAPGFFLTHHLDHAHGARGFSLTFGYAYWILHNMDRETNRNFHRVTLSFGWMP